MEDIYPLNRKAMNSTGFSNADYGLIGHPLAHSFSKMFFSQLFVGDGSGRSYENFDLTQLDGATLYNLLLMAPHLEGFNVTSPYKVHILEFLDSVSDTAREVGAVNTVKVVRADDGRVRRLEGHNTDVEGFMTAIRPLVSHFPARTGALVIGSGGASKAACVGLRKLGFEPLVVSRTPSDGLVGYEALTKELMDSHPVIVNATPLGTYPNINTAPPIPYKFISTEYGCFDMVYNPEETLFMRRCAAQGAAVRNGLEMLFAQAVASLSIWEQNNS